MEGRFFACVNFVLQHETTYDRRGNPVCEHDPNDPGGATMFGIDQRSHPHIKVCDLTEDEAKQIYHDNEWTKCRCDDLPVGFDLAVFDAAVNIGMGWAIKALQKVVGVKIDGFIGPNTLAAIIAAPSRSLEAYLQAREAYYKALPTRMRLRYLKGWLKRVTDVRGATQSTTGTVIV